LNIFAPQLQLEPLAKIPSLADRSVPIDEARTTENVSSHVAVGVGRVGIKNGAILREAAAGGFQSELQARGGSNGLADRIRGIQEWDGCVGRSPEIVWIALNVPTIIIAVAGALSGAREIIEIVEGDDGTAIRRSERV
jgi:hypothetical protein